jgi:hypothetical protein
LLGLVAAKPGCKNAHHVCHVPLAGHWNVGGRWEELWTCNAPFREGLDAYLAAGNTSYRSLQEIYQ